MPTKLFEKPAFQRHILHRLKRYDRRLDLLWNAGRGRWELWKGLRGRPKIVIRTNDSEETMRSPKHGFCLEGSIKSVLYEPPPKPFCLMVFGRELNEDEIFFRLWLGDTWRFKNAAAAEKDFAEQEERHKALEEQKMERDFVDIAKDVERYALNKPFMAMSSSKHTDGVRKLAQDRN